MKRVFFAVLIALAVTAVVSAQSYTVQSVSGRVSRTAGNSRVDIAVGDILTADTVVHTGIGSSLVLKEGDKTFTIPAGQSGNKIEDLVNAGSGIRIGGNVTQANTTSASRSAAQIATASARASDAAGFDNIDEE